MAGDMIIYGIGIDLVEVARIEESLNRHGTAFLKRVFTSDEQAYCGSMARPGIHYAARFAAKEAVSKAFGTGIGKHASLVDIEVIRNESGAPSIRLHGNAQAYAQDQGIEQIQLSLSHSENYAVANVLLVARK